MGSGAKFVPSSITIYNYDWEQAASGSEKVYTFTADDAHSSSHATTANTSNSTVSSDLEEYNSTWYTDYKLYPQGSFTITVPYDNCLIGTYTWTSHYTYWSTEWYGGDKGHSGYATLTLTFTEVQDDRVSVSENDVLAQDTDASFTFESTESDVDAFVSAATKGLTITTLSGAYPAILSSYTVEKTDDTSAKVSLVFEKNTLSYPRYARVWVASLISSPLVTFKHLANNLTVSTIRAYKTSNSTSVTSEITDNGSRVYSAFVYAGENVNVEVGFSESDVEVKSTTTVYGSAEVSANGYYLTIVTSTVPYYATFFVTLGDDSGWVEISLRVYNSYDFSVYLGNYASRTVYLPLTGATSAIYPSRWVPSASGTTSTEIVHLGQVVYDSYTSSSKTYLYRSIGNMATDYTISLVGETSDGDVVAKITRDQLSPSTTRKNCTTTRGGLAINTSDESYVDPLVNWETNTTVTTSTLDHTLALYNDDEGIVWNVKIYTAKPAHLIVSSISFPSSTGIIETLEKYAEEFDNNNQLTSSYYDVYGHFYSSSSYDSSQPAHMHSSVSFEIVSTSTGYNVWISDTIEDAVSLGVSGEEWVYDSEDTKTAYITVPVSTDSVSADGYIKAATYRSATVNVTQTPYSYVEISNSISSLEDSFTQTLTSELMPVVDVIGGDGNVTLAWNGEQLQFKVYTINDISVTLSHTDDDTITSDDITTLYTEEIQVTYSASATGTS